jgi:hypothetical protein
MHKAATPYVPVQPGFLPLIAAAAWTGVSPKTVKRWLSRGLPFYQEAPKSKVLIRPIDIEEFLIRRQVPQSDLDTMVEEVVRGLH